VVPFSNSVEGVATPLARFALGYEAPPVPLGVVRRFAEGHDGPTPYLLCDLNVIDAKLARLRAALPGVVPHYAMKANPEPRLVARLQRLGAGFEIASIHELNQLLGQGINPATVIFSNPIKPAAAIAEAHAHGVSTMVVDSLDEVRKIAAVSPHIQLCLRLETANTGSDWPLTGKFGASMAEAYALIDYCADHSLLLTGLTFHVGSQCRNAENWQTGIASAAVLFERMLQVGLSPNLLNLGGGFPIQHTRPMPSIEAIGTTVMGALARLDGRIKIICEPGRYLVGDACWMVTEVVGTATRKGRRWVYLDVGAFTGLTETLEKFDYELFSDRVGPLLPTTVAGPTCDSADLLFSEKMLPADLVAGDRIYIANAGAYTASYASTFNGFPAPALVVLA